MSFSISSFIGSISSTVIIRVLIGGFVVVGIFAGVQSYRLALSQKNLADLQATVISAELDATIEKLRVESIARTQIEKTRIALTKELSNALESKDRLIADLRSGNRRLRKELQCPSSNLSTPSSHPTGDSGSANIRIQNAAAMAIQLADECDAAIRATQAIIITNRDISNE